MHDLPSSTQVLAVMQITALDPNYVFGSATLVVLIGTVILRWLRPARGAADSRG